MDTRETRKKYTYERFSQFQNKPKCLATPTRFNSSIEVTTKTDIESTLYDLLVTVSDTKTPKKRDEKAVVTLLSTPGIDVNAKDIYGNSPLVYSCAKNNTQSVKLLLAAPDIDVNFRDPFGRTPIMIALLYQSKETLHILLNDHRVDINENIKSDCGRTLEDWINETEDEPEIYLEMIKKARNEREKEKCVQTNVSIEPQNNTCGDEPDLQLAEAKLALDEQVETAAEALDELDTAAEALDEHLDTAPKTKLSLIKSKVKSSLAVFRSNLSELADGFVCPECRTEKFAVASLLTEHLTQHFPAPQNEKNVFDLIKNISKTEAMNEEDKQDLVALLDTPRANLNARDKYGNTPLAYSCAKNNAQLVKLLLEAPHIDVNFRDPYGRTPIMIALLYQSKETVQLLLNDHRVDINEGIVSDCGRTLEDWVDEIEDEKEIYAEMITKARSEREMEDRIRILCETNSLKLSKVNPEAGEHLLKAVQMMMRQVKLKAKSSLDLVSKRCSELATAIICPECGIEGFTLKAMMAQHLAKHLN